MRSRIDKCDVALVPYNYLLDKDLRRNLALPLENAVVILDEGHNIEQFCEELYGFELNHNDLFCAY